MTRILYVISTAARTGPIIQLKYLCQELDKSNYQCWVVTLSKNPNDNILNDLREMGINVICLDKGRSASFFSVRRALKNLIAEIAPDVIHSHGVRSDFLAQSLANNIPHVMTLHNYPLNDYPVRYGFLGRCLAYFHLWLIASAQMPVACSKSVESLLSKRLKKPIKSISNGVDTSFYHPITTDEKKRLKSRLGFSADRKIILSTSALIEGKRPQIIVQAFMATPLNKKTDLVMIGDGELRNDLEEVAQSHPNVHFLGFQEDVRPYLQIADIYVSTSASEGLPNAVLEAISSGLPVVLSDIPPHRELDADKLNYGCYAEVDDIIDFSHKLTDIRDKDTSEAGRLARAACIERYSKERMASRYMQLYTNLLSLK